MTAMCLRCGLTRSVPECPCASRAAADPVNLSHYHGDYVMRIIEEFKLDFLSGTVVKYLLRAGNKPGDSELQDLKKASWYLNRKIAGSPATSTEPLSPTAALASEGSREVEHGPTTEASS